MATTHSVPSLPELGRPERFYIEHVHEADRYRDTHAHEAYKVGQYISRAVNYASSWDEKLRCFLHALRHHCTAPASASPAVVEFYGQLAHLVRQEAGREALRFASMEDDRFAARLASGEPRDRVARDARVFFISMLHTDHRPEWMNLEDYDALKILKKYWF